MGRPRVRVTLEDGPRLDLAHLIPRGRGGPGSIVAGRFTWGLARVELWARSGTLRLTFNDRVQVIALVPSVRHLGGCQWYALCPVTGRKVRVLFRPPGAYSFGSRHAWGRQVVYASQFEDPIARAHRTQAKVKARVLGDEDPDDWDLPPKPKRMRWATYNRLEAEYDEAEARIEEHLCRAAGRLLGIFSQQISKL